MSKILLSILLSTFCFFVFAEVAPYLVVGIGNKKIPLEFNSEEGVKKSHPHWVKEPEKMMIVEFPVSKNWREGRFSFTPKESGSLLFILKTNPVRRGGICLRWDVTLTISRLMALL